MKGMERNAGKPTAVVSLDFGDFFSFDDLKAVEEILEPQFHVKGSMYAGGGVEEVAGPIIAGSMEIIGSSPTREILLGLASEAIWDAILYIRSAIKIPERFRETETQSRTPLLFRISLRIEANFTLERKIDINAPDTQQKIAQARQQARETLSHLDDD